MQRLVSSIAPPKGRAMKSKRQSSVKIVFGTLTQFMEICKVNHVGVEPALCIRTSLRGFQIRENMTFSKVKHSITATKAIIPITLKRIVFLTTFLSSNRFYSMVARKYLIFDKSISPCLSDCALSNTSIINDELSIHLI